MPQNTIIEIYNNLLYSTTFISTLAAFITSIIAYKKLKNPLIKYTVFILVPALAITITEQIFSTLILFLGDTPELTFARVLCSYLVFSGTIFSHMYFFHKVIGEPFGLVKKIIFTTLAVINMLDFIRKVMTADLWNRDVTTVIITSCLIYLILIYHRNRDKITWPLLKVFHKTYATAAICYIVWAYSSLAVSTWWPEYHFILETANVFLLSQIIFHAFVGFIMFKLILAPQTDNNTEDIENILKNNYNLTGQETKLTMLLAQGYTAKEISEKIFVSPQTTKNYTSRVYKKLGVKNKFELMNLMKQQGF